MNTQELAPIIASAPLDSNGQPLRVVCLDEGCVFDVKFTRAKLDANGSVVTSDRLASIAEQRLPLDRALQEEVYSDPESHEYWKSRHPTFQDFYNFMENARLSEIKLVDEAVEVAVLHADYMEM